MIDPKQDESLEPGHARGGEFNHETAKDPGAGGIGARIHTEGVDPYQPPKDETAAPPPQLPERAA